MNGIAAVGFEWIIVLAVWISGATASQNQCAGPPLSTIVDTIGPGKHVVHKDNHIRLLIDKDALTQGSTVTLTRMGADTVGYRIEFASIEDRTKSISLSIRGTPGLTNPKIMGKGKQEGKKGKAVDGTCAGWYRATLTIKDIVGEDNTGVLMAPPANRASGFVILSN